MERADHPRQWLLAASGSMPNNPRLPVLLHHIALPAGDPASALEDRFAKHGWQGLWRNGVFSYHHYHSGAHEVLGVARGTAELLIGGEEGVRLSVVAGDVLILPAGTAHKNLGHSADFLVIGGYPPGQRAEIETGPPSKADLRRIADLDLPAEDPVEGSAGSLVRLWQAAKSG
ncbi:cupin [Rhizobium sp. YIM 134829]|uniref:cupin n=1 Tax=Rhizobium sp. YIM 134829 TaxID=3390453 RepID=UPI00397E5C3D